MFEQKNELNLLEFSWILKSVLLVNFEIFAIRDEIEKSQYFIFHFEILFLELFKAEEFLKKM